MEKKKCPYCGKEAKVIPFGNRYIAVCCNEIIYVGHEAPSEDETQAAEEGAPTRQQR